MLKDLDMKNLAKEAVKDYPSETVNMIEQCDINSLHFNNLHYRPPWNLFVENFSKGNVIVAGDAKHVMAPALGQGGSAALEDSVVLARCMAQKMIVEGLEGEQQHQKTINWGKAELAFDQFLKERRSRVWWLSLNTHIIVSLSQHASSKAIRFLCIFFLIALFRKPLWDVQYNCGRL